MTIFKTILFPFIVSTTACILSFGQQDTSHSGNQKSLLHRLTTLHERLSFTDSNYISKQPGTWIISAQNNNWMDVYEIETAPTSSVGLRSALCMNLGLTVTYKVLSIGYSVNLNEAITHKNTGNELNVNLNYNRFSASVYYWKNAGNSIISNYSDSHIQKEMSYDFNGLSVKSYGLDLCYYFNHRRFANGAAYFGYSSRQEKSAGSFITGIQINRQFLQIDFQDIPDTVVPAEIQALNPVSLNYTGFCGSFGYGYSYVFAPDWLLNLTDIVGVGFRKELHPSNYEDFPNMIKNSVKLALIHNTTRYYWGFNCQYLTSLYPSGQTTISSSLAIFNVFAGFRLG